MNTKARRKRVQLILNGKVAANDALRAAVSRQRKAGHRIEVRVTWEKGDARRFASKADEMDVVVAAGGDGTVNEVLHGLMDMLTVSRPSLGIVPLGTANDFAIACGIPRDPEKALALCMRGAEVPIDVGKANNHWFINAASLPNREIIGSGPVAIVGNGRQAGGGIQVAPRACIDDGLLDVLVVRPISPTALLAAARELQQLPPDGEYVSYWQTPWLEVHPEEAIPVNLDGEPLSFSTVRYEAVPKAIQLIVPPNCQLLSRGPRLKA